MCNCKAWFKSYMFLDVSGLIKVFNVFSWSCRCNLDSEEYASKHMDTKDSDNDKTHDLKYCWPTVHHTIVLNCPACTKFVMQDRWMRETVTLERKIALTLLLVQLWVIWLSWGCATLLQPSKFFYCCSDSGQLVHSSDTPETNDCCQPPVPKRFFLDVYGFLYQKNYKSEALPLSHISPLKNPDQQKLWKLSLLLFKTGEIDR